MKKEIKDDIKYAIVKAGLGSIPIVGSAASELLQLIVTPPLDKRRNEWMEKIGEQIKQLEEQNKLDLNELSQNGIFLDVVLETTQLALKTSEKEKINFYRNAVLNTAVGDNPEQAEIQMFLNFIASFTVWHVKILALFDDPTDWFRKNNRTVQNYMAASLSNTLEDAYPELRGRSEFYNLIWQDLFRAGFHKTSDLQVMMSGSGLMAERTTSFGKKFLEFINENPLD